MSETTARGNAFVRATKIIDNPSQEEFYEKYVRTNRPVLIRNASFWTDGVFDPVGVLEVLGRPRVHRVLWFTLWSATLGTLLSLGKLMAGVYITFGVRF